MPKKKRKRKNDEPKITYRKTVNGRYLKRLPTGRCLFCSKKEAEAGGVGSGPSSVNKKPPAPSKTDT